MKKLLIVFALVVATLSVVAQPLPASKVPPSVKKGFIKEHPSVTPKWEKEDGNFEASFKQGGVDRSCIIDDQGTILETETGITFTALPKKAQDYLKAHYKGHKIKEVSKIVKQDRKVEYEAMVNDMDVMFDMGGNFLKEIKKEKD